MIPHLCRSIIVHVEWTFQTLRSLAPACLSCSTLSSSSLPCMPHPSASKAKFHKHITHSLLLCRPVVKAPCCDCLLVPVVLLFLQHSPCSYSLWAPVAPYSKPCVSNSKHTGGLFSQCECLGLTLLEVLNVWDKGQQTYSARPFPGYSDVIFPCEIHSSKCYGCKNYHITYLFVL